MRGPPSRRAAFTLVELAYVIAILGLLTAIVVPTYDQIYRRARATEPRTMLEAIAYAELQH
jgi:prepilin-type N-terminal cleavage/methylation domain-containing protein